MKVLFDYSSYPFFFAHGGFQVQIEQTKAALEANGVEVEYLRWWDDAQKASIIHFFGAPPILYLSYALQKGFRVVAAPLLTATGSRPPWKLWIQRVLIAAARRTMPGIITGRFAWESYRRSDACVALTSWEGHLMSYLYGAPRNRVHVVPNGVEEVFLNSQPVARGPWLVCTATITERKRVLELAEAAVRAQTPVWIIGKAYSDSEPYAQKFLRLAREQPRWIRYEGAIGERTRLARVYREARGFALLSTMESLSLSALEAAACECPLLLSDLPWARTTFNDSAAYCPVAATGRTVAALRRFYDAAPGLKPPPKPLSWSDVARQLKGLYERLLSTPR